MSHITKQIFSRHMRRIGFTLAGASLLALSAGCSTDEPETSPVVENSIGLTAFRACDPLLDYFHEEAISMIENGFHGGRGIDDIALGQPEPSAEAGTANGENRSGDAPRDPVEGQDFSGTNIQERGVDEPDLIKTDGQYIYTVANGHLVINEADGLDEVSQTELNIDSERLLIHGDQAIVIGQIYGATEERFQDANPERMARGHKTSFSVYDLSDRAEPQLIRRLYIEGRLQAARLVDGTMRAAITFMGEPSIDFDGLGDRDRPTLLPPSGGSATEPAPAEASSAGSEGSSGEQEDRPAMAPVPDEDGGEGGLPIDADDEVEPEAEEIEAPREGRPEQAEDEFIALLTDAINATPLSDWVPMAYDAIDDERLIRQVTRCEQFRRPGERSGIAVTSVISIDLDEPTAQRSEPAVISGPGVVYANGTDLYLTTSNYGGQFGREGPVSTGVVRGGPEVVSVEEATAGGEEEGEEEQEDLPVDTMESPLRVADDDRSATQIHRFDISNGDAVADYRSSGRVFGIPLNQFSLSAYEGALRIATTEDQRGEEFRRVNHVFVLEEIKGPNGDELTISGQINDIAETERIYAVRFVGEKGFVVTFRQTDPLFTIDLSDPADPFIVGELHIPGFSTYLHPYGAEHLIGIGQSATDEGRITGMQLSLFDVSDFANPELAHRQLLGQGSSEAIYNHHAFTFWAPLDLLMIPLQSYDNEARRIGLELYNVSTDNGFAVGGFIHHEALVEEEFGGQPAIRRSIIMGDQVLTVSAYGLMTHDLDSLEATAQANFPEPREHRGGRLIGGEEPGVPEPEPAPEAPDAPEEPEDDAEEVPGDD